MEYSKSMLQLVLVGMRVSVYLISFLKHWDSNIPSNQAIHLSTWHERLHTLHVHLLTWHIILHNRHIYPHTLHVHLHISTYNYSPGMSMRAQLSRCNQVYTVTPEYTHINTRHIHMIYTPIYPADIHTLATYIPTHLKHRKLHTWKL